MTNTDAELIAEADALYIRSTTHQHAKLLDEWATRTSPTSLAPSTVKIVLALIDEHEDMNCHLRERLAALTAEGATGVPEGWKLVPVKATAKMIAYGEGYADFVLPSGFENTQESRRREMATAYGVMVEASPNPPVRPEQSASEPGRSSSPPTEGPAPVEAPHSVGNVRVTADGAVERASQVDEDASTVRRFIGGTTIVWDTPPTSRAEALAALGRLADGARR